MKCASLACGSGGANLAGEDVLFYALPCGKTFSLLMRTTRLLGAALFWHILPRCLAKSTDMINEFSSRKPGNLQNRYFMYDFSPCSGGCADFHRPRAERSIIVINDQAKNMRFIANDK